MRIIQGTKVRITGQSNTSDRFALGFLNKEASVVSEHGDYFKVSLEDNRIINLRKDWVTQL